MMKRREKRESCGETNLTWSIILKKDAFKGLLSQPRNERTSWRKEQLATWLAPMVFQESDKAH